LFARRISVPPVSIVPIDINNNKIASIHPLYSYSTQRHLILLLALS
jgi:hypothetical protein